MFSNATGVIHSLVFFCIIALLQCVSGHVAQLPGTIPELVPSPSLATSNRSLARSINGVFQEHPPDEFRVEYFWKNKARSFGRSDFLDTMLLDMATMALKDWNSLVPAFRFSAPHEIAMGFVSSRQGSGLRIKHIIWALEEIFDIVVEHNKHLPGNVVIQLVPMTIGLGNLYTVPAGSALVNPLDLLTKNSTDSATGNSILNTVRIPPKDTTLATDLALPDKWQGNASPVQTLPLLQAYDTSTHVNATGSVSVQFSYRPNGALVNDTQVYNASLKLIIRAAEPADITASIWPGLSTYNDMDNFTLNFRPESFALRKDLCWFDAIFALASIAGTMAKHRGTPGGKFAEIDGSIAAGTTFIGRFCIDKGDTSRRNPEDVCTGRIEGSGNGEDGVATA